MLHLSRCTVNVQALYAIFALLYLVAEISLLVMLVVRRQYKVFPVFTLSIALNLFDNVIIGISMAVSPPIANALAFGLLPLEYLVDLAVLLEIAWNVLRPVQTSLPRGSIRAFVVATLLAVSGGVLLALHFKNTGNKIQDIKIPLDVTVGLLRMLIFAAIAGFAQLLGIGWRNKVLQLATGLSFNSAAQLVVSLIGRYHGDSQGVEALGVVATALELSFFVWVFATKEAARREFDPQMEQFLVTLAGRAKHARTAFSAKQVN
jgi:uncharacterized membrane protein